MKQLSPGTKTYKENQQIISNEVAEIKIKIKER